MNRHWTELSGISRVTEQYWWDETAATEYWLKRERKVKDIAYGMGFEIEIEMLDSCDLYGDFDFQEFVYEIFDYGEFIPPSNEIIEAIEIAIEQHFGSLK